jgi:hypothetical protein
VILEFHTRQQHEEYEWYSVAGSASLRRGCRLRFFEMVFFINCNKNKGKQFAGKTTK